MSNQERRSPLRRGRTRSCPRRGRRTENAHTPSVWVAANRSTLVQLVQNANVDELRRVAAALNYAAEEPQLEE